jgi:hypothetical protein
VVTVKQQQNQHRKVMDQLPLNASDTVLSRERFEGFMQDDNKGYTLELYICGIRGLLRCFNLAAFYDEQSEHVAGQYFESNKKHRRGIDVDDAVVDAFFDVINKSTDLDSYYEDICDLPYPSRKIRKLVKKQLGLLRDGLKGDSPEKRNNLRKNFMKLLAKSR